jgi:hypothetical protein
MLKTIDSFRGIIGFPEGIQCRNSIIRTEKSDFGPSFCRIGKSWSKTRDKKGFYYGRPVFTSLIIDAIKG